MCGSGPPEPVPVLWQGEGLHQLREALKILAERVLILETMIGLYGEWGDPLPAGPVTSPWAADVMAVV